MGTFKKLVGRRIAAKRRASGYTTQSAFALAMDVDRARVSDWERGKREPRGKTKARLLEKLGATEPEIFGLLIGTAEGDQDTSQEQVDRQHYERQSNEADDWRREKSGPKGHVPPMAKGEIDPSREHATDDQDRHTLASEIAEKVLIGLSPKTKLSQDESEFLNLFREASSLGLKRAVLSQIRAMIRVHNKSEVRARRK